MVVILQDRSQVLSLTIHCGYQGSTAVPEMWMELLYGGGAGGCQHFSKLPNGFYWGSHRSVQTSGKKGKNILVNVHRDVLSHLWGFFLKLYRCFPPPLQLISLLLTKIML